MSVPYFNQRAYLDKGTINGTLIKKISNYFLFVEDTNNRRVLALTRSIAFQTRLITPEISAQLPVWQLKAFLTCSQWL